MIRRFKKQLFSAVRKAGKNYARKRRGKRMRKAYMKRFR